MAREDREHSPQRRGFSLLLISRNATPPGYPIPLYRHIISTDPRSGADLQGLGKQLEALEQAAEEQGGWPLRGGRERVAPGTGRHGYNLASPWYDGRGHQFTIVDSPSIRIDDQLLCASCLTPAQALEAVRWYGNTHEGSN